MASFLRHSVAESRLISTNSISYAQNKHILMTLWTRPFWWFSPDGKVPWNVNTGCKLFIPRSLWIRKLQFSDFTRATVASASISCRRVSVCLSVRLSLTSRCSTETAKRRITQIMPHDSPESLVFSGRKFRRNSNGVTPKGGAKCRWGRLNACLLYTSDAADE